MKKLCAYCRNNHRNPNFMCLARKGGDVGCTCECTGTPECECRCTVATPRNTPPIFDQENAARPVLRPVSHMKPTLAWGRQAIAVADTTVHVLLHEDERRRAHIMVLLPSDDSWTDAGGFEGTKDECEMWLAGWINGWQGHHWQAHHHRQPADPFASWYDSESIAALVWIDNRSPDRTDEIDQMLATIDASKLPVSGILDILSSTWPLKPALPSRAAFVEKARAILVQRIGEERTSALLKSRA